MLLILLGIRKGLARTQCRLFSNNIPSIYLPAGLEDAVYGGTTTRNVWKGIMASTAEGHSGGIDNLPNIPGPDSKDLHLHKL